MGYLISGESCILNVGISINCILTVCVFLVSVVILIYNLKSNTICRCILLG